MDLYHKNEQLSGNHWKIASSNPDGATAQENKIGLCSEGGVA